MTTSPVAGPELSRDLTRAANDFAISLFRSTGGAGAPGTILAPFTLAAVLAMAGEGARGTTAREIGAALRLPSGLARPRDAERPWDFGALLDHLAGLLHDLSEGIPEEASVRAEIARLRGVATGSAAGRLEDLLRKLDQYVLRASSAAWVDAGLPVEPAFLERIERFAGIGGLRGVDFVRDPAGACAEVNRWADRATQGRVGDLLHPGMLPPETGLVLTSAVYFLGSWSYPFPRADTRVEGFRLAEGGTASVRLMHGQPRTARYAAFHPDGTFFETPRQVPESDREAALVPVYPEEGGFAMVELPYKGGRLAMVVIAPGRPDGLPGLEDRLDATSLATWLEHLVARPVGVALPRFRICTRRDVTGSLGAAGLRAALGDEADFRGISTARHPAGPLRLSAVSHTATVEVNEEGTEATGVSGLHGMFGASAMRPFHPEFRADRPFLFLIRDRGTDAVLFLGRFMGPEEGGWPR